LCGSDSALPLSYIPPFPREWRDSNPRHLACDAITKPLRPVAKTRISLSFVHPPPRRPSGGACGTVMCLRLGIVLYPIELHRPLLAAAGLEPATSRLRIDNQTTPARSRNAGRVDDLRALIMGQMITEGLRPGVGSVISAYCTNLQEGKYKNSPETPKPLHGQAGEGLRNAP